MGLGFYILEPETELTNHSTGMPRPDTSDKRLSITQSGIDIHVQTDLMPR